MAYDLEELGFRIIRVLRAQPGRSLADLAGLFSVGRHTVRRAVRHVTGKSFRDFRAHLVASAARALIEDNPVLSVKEAARILGYSSGSSLARVVRKVFKKSPSDLRKRTGNRRGSTRTRADRTTTA